MGSFLSIIQRIMLNQATHLFLQLWTFKSS